jgi:hypothetical protein
MLSVSDRRLRRGGLLMIEFLAEMDLHGFVRVADCDPDAITFTHPSTGASEYRTALPETYGIAFARLNRELLANQALEEFNAGTASG